MAASCFTAGTLITLFDGSKKSIEDVAIGDYLLGGRGSPNRVIQFDHPLLEDRKLYTLNGGDPFVTEEHPFMTKEGWKSINPAATAIENSSLRVETLVIGDILVLESGESTLETLTSSSAAPDVQLYNFKLSGGHTYYADEYLVHNKGAAGAGTGDASDASDDQGAAAAAAAGQGPPGSDTGAGEMGEGNTGPPGGPGPGSGMDDAGINVSWGKATPSVADTANTENIGITTPEAISSVSKARSAFSLQQQQEKTLAKEVAEFIAKAPKSVFDRNTYTNIAVNYDPKTVMAELKAAKSIQDSFGNAVSKALFGLHQKVTQDEVTGRVGLTTEFKPIGSIALSLAMPTPTLSNLNAVFGLASTIDDLNTPPDLSPTPGSFAETTANVQSTVADALGLSTDPDTAGTTPGETTAPAASVATNMPTNTPDDNSGGGTESSRRINRAASNNITLAIANDDELTRNDLRRARRQITRFA